MQIIAQLSIESVSGDEHLSNAIADVVELLRDRGIEFEVGPGGTSMVGDAEDVFACLQACHQRLSKDHDRVRSVVQLDQRPSFPEDALEARVKKVSQKLHGEMPERRDSEQAQAFRNVSA